MKNPNKDHEDEFGRIRLGLDQDVESYTPVVEKRTVDELAREFNVTSEQVLAALRKWWWERIQDQLSAFRADVAKVQYNSSMAETFAQKFL